MQTNAIPYRVADFLKQHPPFQFFDEADLVALAGRGRVKFHEPDEYICWQSSPHTPFIYVIQQGSVSLWDESVDPPTLRDMRGPGDIIGMERYHGSATSLYSAKSASEVVIYALNAADLEPLLARYPRAEQYAAAYSEVTSDYRAPGERPEPHEIFLADLVRDRHPVRSPASTPIHEAAHLLNESGVQALALTDGTALAALLTAGDVLRWVASGAPDAGQPALNIVNTAVLAVAPQMTVSDCVLAMAESRTSAVALTNDGTVNSTLQSIVTSASLGPAFGDNPATILHEIDSAPRVDALRALNDRARAWLLNHLSTPSALDWLALWADLVNRRILARLLHLMGHNDPARLCCFVGAAGRQERLAAAAPRLAFIGHAPESLESALAECGYISPEPPISGSLEEWKARFTGWIGDPVRNAVYHARPLFDMRPVQGPRQPFDELEAHVKAELKAEPMFLRLLAHDCLSSLPPLTFFRDLVVEESGEQTDTFRLETSALRPLVDVARVLSLAAGMPLGASTRDRFDRARRLMPEQDAIFRESAETMRIVLFYQARAGLRLRSAGTDLPLSALSRLDRQVLKSGFRSIHKLLEFTAAGDWLEAL